MKVKIKLFTLMLFFFSGIAFSQDSLPPSGEICPVDCSDDCYKKWSGTWLACSDSEKNEIIDAAISDCGPGTVFVFDWSCP